MKTIEVGDDTFAELLAEKRPSESFDSLINRLLAATKNSVDVPVRRKLLLIGPPGSGKSTIREVFFRERDPSELVGDDVAGLDPTTGIEYHAFEWFGVQVGVADSSGQEIDRWFERDKEEAFGGCDAVVFVFDVKSWEKDRASILQDLYRTYLTKFLMGSHAEVFVFAHKKDLVPLERHAHLLAEVTSALRNHLVENKLTVERVNCYLTSVRPKYVLSVISAFRAVLARILKNLFSNLMASLPTPTSFLKERIKKLVGKETENP
ncbi:MAG: hypothetical protein Kow0069_33670 [Promethearchaeota archaeon]